ncbi:MAG: AraC family transcriptional regulator [Actinomycetota bacterium]|nr:AraC family transcriptional regulator [Actinomycetota bacterium]
MNAAAPDRLRAMLDLVVAGAAEPGLDSADLAARAYLSRFHFDRLVSAAVGEPPGALRRRLMLERAAYHLVHTHTAATEVAFDAGYGSLEAFTRAFSRAYGRAPSRLRANPPADLLLPAPNGIHFHPPGGLRLPATRRRSAMDIVNRMLGHDAWLVDQMLDRAGTLTDVQLDRPIEVGVEGIDDAPTLRSLLARLVFTKEMWTAAVEGRTLAADAGAGIDELRARHAAAAPHFLQLVGAALREGRADETFIDATCEPPHTFTYGGMIAHVLTFSAHRRTLALGALHDAGITDLGAGDPSGFVAA